LFLAASFAWALAGCTDTSPVEIDLGRSDPDRILSYYFSIYTGADPFETKLIYKGNGNYYIDKENLSGNLEGFNKYTDDEIIDWDELKEELESSYYEKTSAPKTLDKLMESVFEETFDLEVHGVMSEAKRKISVTKNSLHFALGNFKDAGERLIYPLNTTFVASHLEDEEVVETTVMRKVSLENWVYWVYDGEGELNGKTVTEPRQLNSPTQCIGCHMGQKAFEPEASFPEKLEEKEKRRRQIYVSDEIRKSSPVDVFDEHMKRDDSVLGLYASIYLGQLISQDSDSLSVKERRILTSFLQDFPQ